MLLLRVRDRDDDLIRDKVRVSAPSHHEELTLVVRVVNSLWTDDLSLGPRGAQYRLRHLHGMSMRWDTFHGDKDLLF